MEFFEIKFDESFAGAVFVDDDNGGCDPLKSKKPSKKTLKMNFSKKVKL